jgi:hypothetical protein
MRKYFSFLMLIGLINLDFYSAQAACSQAPDKPLINVVADASGIDFKVSPATTGCETTTLKFTYTYFDKNLNNWDKWTNWAIGSNIGKSFSIKIPAIEGKSRIAFAATASNKWGESALSRENQTGNGVEFPTTKVETIFVKDVYQSNVKVGTFQLILRHPQSIECGVHTGFATDNCRFDFEYELRTDVSDSKSLAGVLGESFNIDIVDEKGSKVGYLARNYFQYLYSYKNVNSPISASANVKVETKVKFKLTPGTACDKFCREVSSKEMVLRPITQEEANKRQAAIEANKQKAADEAAKAEAAQQAAKKLTITCLSGKQSRKVTGETPQCPVGFQNPQAKHLTFQAYSSCRLYKKDALVGGAQLKDGGRTLILDAVQERSYQINALLTTDYSCVIKILKMPAFIESKVGSTRAIDGMQRAQWNKVSAFWTFHPDDGLNIVFNSK